MAPSRRRDRRSTEAGSPMTDVDQLIDRLGLEPHPEGGWYRELHRSDWRLPRSALPTACRGPRPLMTSILFCLPAGTRSRPHRLAAEELWLHHLGDGLRLHVGSSPGSAEGDPGHVLHRLGADDEAAFQVVVPRGAWQWADVEPGPTGFALVACVVSPGFDFDDFEMAAP